MLSGRLAHHKGPIAGIECFSTCFFFFFFPEQQSKLNTSGEFTDRLESHVVVRKDLKGAGGEDTITIYARI